MKSKIIILIYASLFFANAGYGGLVFENVAIDEEASPLANEFEFEFPFVNLGGSGVKIISIESSCSCVVSDVEQKVYQPGEKGNIHGKMNIIGQSGNLLQAITVVSDSKENPKTVLSIKLHIPPFAKIKPKLLLWDMGGKSEPKRSAIEINSDFALAVSEAASDSENFNVTMMNDPKDKFKFWIEAAPKSTKEPISAMIKFSIKAKNGETKQHFIHALIR